MGDYERAVGQTVTAGARSHLMGVDRHFYYGYGAGFKRLFMVSGQEGGAEMALPTLRLSIGYAF